MLLTFYDAVAKLLGDAQLSASDPNGLESARRAVRFAAANICTYKDWNLYRSTIAMTFHGTVSTGTVSYSTSTGRVTLTGSTWPEWAPYGELRIGNDEYPVVARISSTVVELDSIQRPASDFSGQTYKLIQRKIPLPLDFKSIGRVIESGDEGEVLNAGAMATYEWQSRFNDTSSAQDLCAVTGDQRFRGMAMQMSPASTRDVTYRALYSRYPSVPEIYSVTGDATCSGTTVTATASKFTARHVGCVIRFAEPSESSVPDLYRGNGMIAAERTIVSVTSGTVAEVDQALTAAESPFLVSDAIDVLPGPMAEAVLALASFEWHKLLNTDARKYAERDFLVALDRAMADDCRYSGPMYGGVGGGAARTTIGEVDVV